MTMPDDRRSGPAKPSAAASPSGPASPSAPAKASIALSMGTSALAPAMAAIVTNPADVAKTRLNMGRELRPGRVGSVLDMWTRIWTTEGLAGLQRGLGLVMVREASKNAFRLGLYEPLVDLLSGAKSRGSGGSSGSSSGGLGSLGAGAPMTVRVAAGAISGGMSALIANPLDLLKVRLQLDPSRAAGRTAADAFKQIVKAEGVTALWRRGSVANVSRSALATSLGLPANSLLKEYANSREIPFLQARPALRDALCALGASAFVTVAINPIDLVRTRLFSAPAGGAAANSGAALASYDGMLHCALRVAATEGIGGFWKGTLASFLRIGPHQTITFCLLGVLQRLALAQQPPGRAG